MLLLSFAVLVGFIAVISVLSITKLPDRIGINQASVLYGGGFAILESVGLVLAIAFIWHNFNLLLLVAGPLALLHFFMCIYMSVVAVRGITNLVQLRRERSGAVEY